MARKERPSNLISDNRRARYNYELLEFYEAGLVLMGSEVKSIRGGHVQINEAYASFSRGELWLVGAHIGLYKDAGYAGHTDERRSRKLLMHKAQLKRLRQDVQMKGRSLIPTKLVFKKGFVKVVLALAEGKQRFDKRATIKEREWNRTKQRLFKGSSN